MRRFRGCSGRGAQLCCRLHSRVQTRGNVEFRCRFGRSFHERGRLFGAPAPIAVAPYTPNPALVDAAKKEGKLVLALHAADTYMQFGDMVKKQFPYLDVQITYIKPSDLAPKVIAEQQRGQFLWDIHSGPASNMHDVLQPAGALQLLPPFLDGISADDTADAKWGSGFKVWTDPVNNYTLITAYTSQGGMTINRDLVPTSQVSTWDDLLKPEFKGKIVAYDPTKNNGTSQGLAGVVATKGVPFVKKVLIDQQTVFVSNSRQAAQWVAEGKYPIGLGIIADDRDSFKAQGIGKNVETITADVPPTLLPSGVSVFKQAPHPAATKLYIDWFLSQAGQDLWAKTIDQGSTRRLDVAKYHTDGIPDYQNLKQYKVVVGTDSGAELVKQAMDVAATK